MKVRLGFSVVTQLDGPILLVDEVLAVGDRKFREKCYQRLEERLAEGRTLFVVSHSEADLRRFCTRGLYMNQGRLVADGELGEVIDAVQRRLRRRSHLTPQRVHRRPTDASTAPPHLDSKGPSMIGLVLAAGAGRRLRPYTDTLPKALVPWSTRAAPASARSSTSRSANFAEVGLTDVVVIVGYRAEAVTERAGRAREEVRRQPRAGLQRQGRDVEQRVLAVVRARALRARASCSPTATPSTPSSVERTLLARPRTRRRSCSPSTRSRSSPTRR